MSVAGVRGLCTVLVTLIVSRGNFMARQVPEKAQEEAPSTAPTLGSGTEEVGFLVLFAIFIFIF